MIADINSRGGLAGRRIVPVFGELDAANSDTYAQQEQAVCAKWTEDHSVAAVVSAINATTNVVQCLQQHGVPFVADDLVPYDRNEYNRHNNLVTPSMLSLDRCAAVHVEALQRQRYFDDGARVGIAYFDEPKFRRALAEIVKPAPGRLGVHLADESAVRRNQSPGELSLVAADAESAAFRFKANDVTHVMFLDIGGYLVAAAENQGLPASVRVDDVRRRGRCARGGVSHAA